MAGFPAALAAAISPVLDHAGFLKKIWQLNVVTLIQCYSYLCTRLLEFPALIFY